MGSAASLAVMLLCGLIAGALDLAFAVVFYGYQGIGAARLLQGIASAAIGDDAFNMGREGAALGAFFHFFISATAALVYFAASQRVALLTQRPLLSGAIFGVLMFLAMRLIVLPLSHIGFHVPKTGNIVGELCSHIFLFGWVIALGASRAARLRAHVAAA
jgi:predicted tellurium resistance membrane protein TerC